MMALLGGTFDPIHCGHLHAAQLGRETLGADAVTLMLAARPWHRPAPQAAVAHRWEMLRLAVAQRPWLRPSRLEATRAGPSYTVDTLAGLAAHRPLVWLIGSDAVAAMAQWHRAEELPALCNLLVFHRPATERPPVPAGFEEAEPAALVGCRSGAIHYLDAPMLPASSTAARRAIAAGQEPAALLPAEVWAYIRRHELYGASDQPHWMTGQPNMSDPLRTLGCGAASRQSERRRCRRK